ncbi:thioredoxin domain-containing protein [Sunxiuqinia sp. A32]|uniref:thioredoxin domain-containing protein n=1 Tax=Sunxiuqinia sp. A32 TaxID=3461496 RepID=UPI004045D3F5
MTKHQYTNDLIHETSPYLLQHAHNPVNWMPWGNEALQTAQKENKLLLISIGYSACHWCHVMEHESFEDDEVAAIMNEHFVCIKVDREERPDIDHIYMTAVQIITQQGGWPLNAIALPDGRPIWGGTYFQREMWISALRQVNAFWKQNPAKTEEYAESLSNGITKSAFIPISSPTDELSGETLKTAVNIWKSYFDYSEGGRKGAPKFMMPNNLQFLLRWAHQKQDSEVENFVVTSLNKMAMGGIYDQVGGGFARYSTDALWKVPHFEKMLYDNGQLLTVYSRAWQKFKKPLYKETIESTIDFMERELLSPEFGFYSALDADSEGIEGKFYVWSKKELQGLINTDFELFADYYNINKFGYWEDGNYILIRRYSDEEFAAKHELNLSNLKMKIDRWKSILLKEREKRVRPGLDDKILTSWNALALSGLVDAYKALGDEKYLELAEKNAAFLKEKLMKVDGTLHHSYKNGESKIEGFLEDYSLLASAYISLFEVTGNETYLNDASILIDKSFDLFFDHEKNIFYFSAKGQEGLISRSIEIHDNVIPASNSIMATNLFRLGHFTGNLKYHEVARNMLKTVVSELPAHPSGYSNWAMLLLSMTDPFYEIAVSGSGAKIKANELLSNYLPQTILCYSNVESKLPLLENRFAADETLIYVCENQACNLPVEKTSDAIKLIE